MATDKKHIAVYLAPEVEQALMAFCQKKGLISKKGTMFSAGVNAALAEFFGIADTTASNIPATTGNIPATTGNIPAITGNIPATTGNIPATTGNIPATTGNIPVESLAKKELPGKF
jgi:hypothetical protein